MSDSPWIMANHLQRYEKKWGGERLNPLSLGALTIGEDGGCTVDHGKDRECRQLAP